MKLWFFLLMTVHWFKQHHTTCHNYIFSILQQQSMCNSRPSNSSRLPLGSNCLNNFSVDDNLRTKFGQPCSNFLSSPLCFTAVSVTHDVLTFISIKSSKYRGSLSIRVAMPLTDAHRAPFNDGLNILPNTEWDLPMSCSR